MQFAITASDRYLGVFETLVNAGWKPLKLFTTPGDQRIHRNEAVIKYAQGLGIEIQISRLGQKDLAALAAAGCEALVVASYNWRIPDWRSYLQYAINFHPSPLPAGRGPYPMVSALLEQQQTWAVSCHQLSEEFDRGKILAAEAFPLHGEECHESLDLKIQMVAKRLAARVASDFPALWTNAREQGAGSYIKLWGPAERALDFSATVDQVLRKVRAFGMIEVTATVNNVNIFVRRAVGWREAHGHTCGAVAHVDGMSLVVAAKDGYIAILEWSFFDPAATTGRIGR